MNKSSQWFNPCICSNPRTDKHELIVMKEKIPWLNLQLRSGGDNQLDINK